MSFTRSRTAGRVLAALALAGGLIAAASPAAAQDDAARLRKLEAEVKALQRQVFPGPDGKYFEPEVVTPPGGEAPAQPQQPVGTPSTSALTDVLARLDSIEAQLSRLTARSEVTGNALSQLEGRVDTIDKRAAEALPPPVQPTGAIPVPDSNGAVAAAAPVPPRPAIGTPVFAPPRPGAGPTADRLAAVRAVVKPQTGNSGDDEYSYGFRLWEAGFYPEAEQQLGLYVDKFPNDPKISYGRNLLGRAYLDDKQPAAAAKYFLENYQKDPNGARAPDSLLFLAESMLALRDNSKACRALAEFSDKFPALAVGRLQDEYARDRKQAACK